jgi:hypothetical protein
LERGKHIKGPGQRLADVEQAAVGFQAIFVNGQQDSGGDRRVRAQPQEQIVAPGVYLGAGVAPAQQQAG